MLSEVPLEELNLCETEVKVLTSLRGKALRFLDILLEIPEIHAIQWVPGAGRDYWADWIEVYQRIQKAGKALQIASLPLTDIGPKLFDALRPQGVWISSVEGIKDQAQAEAALKALIRWK